MNRDVFLSLLALDAYNRGPSPLVNSLPVSGSIGTATILTDALAVMDQNTVLSAGFYAIAYDWNNETVISYRGTNFPSGITPDALKAFFDDFWGGWNFFLGFARPNQADLAKDFYGRVTTFKFSGEPGFVDPFDFPIGAPSPNDVVLTGHSLGGALAGYVGARAYAPTFAFDPIPFGDVATSDAFSDAFSRTVQDLALNAVENFESILPTLLSPTALFPGTEVTLGRFVDQLAQNILESRPRFESVSGHYLEGEIANQIPTLQTKLGLALGALGASFPGTFSGLLLGALGNQQAIQGQINTASTDRDGVTPIGNRGLPDQTLFDLSLDSVALHSMPWLTLMLFGEKQWAPTGDGREGNGSGWEAGIRFVLPGIASDDIGAALGRDGTTGNTSAGGQLANIIAYSVLNEGERPFGDSGARALFNDASDLGAAQGDLSEVVNEKVRLSIGNLVAEYAGLLATNRFLSNEWSQATDGVLILGSSEEGSSIGIDLTDRRWSLNNSIDAAHDPFSAQGLINQIITESLAETIDGANSQFVRDKLIQFLNDRRGSRSENAYDDIDFVTVSLSSGKLFKSNESQKRQLLIGTDSDERFLLDNLGVSPAIVIAGGGDDEITGTSLDDALIGGGGNDELVGGAGNDWFFGGSGQDRIFGDERNGANGSGFIDTVVYADPGTITIKYDGTSPTYTVRVTGNRENDTLSGIEVIQVRAQLARFDLVGTLTADTNLSIDLLGYGQFIGAARQIIDGRGLQHAITVNLNRGGVSQIANRKSGGVIALTGFNTEIVGSDFSDWIFDGSDEEKRISGLDGDDEITVEGTRSPAELIGGSGSDTLKGGEGGDLIDGETDDDFGGSDQLWGGGGADIFLTNAGDVIHDADISDRIKLNGSQLLGGKQADDGSSEYVDFSGIQYLLNGSTLNVLSNGNTLKITNFRNGLAGIRLIDADDDDDGDDDDGDRPDLDEAERNRDPLIIDLDGDRNVIAARDSVAAYFDLNNDGFAERVTWSRAGDGFLVRDLDGDGVIDRGSEMFGTGVVEFRGERFGQFGEDGFIELALLDSNADFVISAADAQFATLKVWVDANLDAITDEGELRTLESLGIVSISLRTFGSDHVPIIGDASIIARASTVGFTDGRSTTIYDAYLSVDAFDSRERLTDFAVDPRVADLPFLLGSGRVSDLDVAMSRDAGLAELVREFADFQTCDAAQILAKTQQIVLRWTGADQVAPDSRGPNVSAQWLHALEAITGEDFFQA